MTPERRRLVIKVIVSLAVVAGIYFGLLPKLADVSEVEATVRAMTWLEITTLAAVALWNLASYWIVMVSVLPGLPLRRAAAVNLVGGAVSNSVPGGGAIAVGVTYSMLSSWGFDRGAIALSVLVSGIWNTFVKLGLPVLALALLVTERSAGGSLVIGSVIGIGVLVGFVGLYALMLRSEALARGVGSKVGGVVTWLRMRVRREPVGDWGEAAVLFRRQTIGLLRARWLSITLASVFSHLALFLVLLLTLRHVGVSNEEVSWIAVLGAFAFVRLLSALPITPGGIGVVELGLAAALVVAGGDREQVVAAVLVYRALTFLPAIPLGAIVYVLWRRTEHGRTAPVAAEATPAPAGVMVTQGPQP